MLESNFYFLQAGGGCRCSSKDGTKGSINYIHHGVLTTILYT